MKLSDRQIHALKMMGDFPKSSKFYAGLSVTVQTLRSLEKRGLIVEGHPCGRWSSAETWSITDEGRSALEAIGEQEE